MPNHLEGEELQEFEKAKEAINSSKEKLRGSDYRFWAVILSMLLGNKARLTIAQLLNTLAELCELCYAPDHKRSPRFILRFYNVAFLHGNAYTKVFKKPETLTFRKMYGTYWHSLMSHTPFVSRIISLSAVNTEEEEHHFADINSISRRTSNGKPGHIIPNSVLRLQAEKAFKQHREKPLIAQQSRISKFACKIPKRPNTEIFGKILDSTLYQAHLERIADFLLPGEGVWWHLDQDSKSVVFHDAEGEPDYHPEGPSLTHFRSSTLDSVQSHLHAIWARLISAEHIKLPIERVRVYGVEEILPHRRFHLFTDENEEVEYDPEDENLPKVNVEDLGNRTDLICTNLVKVVDPYTVEVESDDDSDQYLPVVAVSDMLCVVI